MDLPHHDKSIVGYFIYCTFLVVATHEKNFE